MSAEMEDLSQYSREERLQFCRILANMIGADHKVTEEEQNQLANLVWMAGLSMTEDDVAAAINQELFSPSPMAELVKGIDKPELRRWLYRVLVEIAYVDDHMAAQEEEKLLQMAELFDLNRDAARELIKWTQESIALERRNLDIMAKL